MQLTEEAKIKLVIDGKESANYLDTISGKIGELKDKQAELGKRTKENAAEYDLLKKEISGLQKEYDDLTDKMNVNEMSVKQLEKYQRELLKATKELAPGNDDYIKSTERLREVNGRLTDLRKDFVAVKDDVDKSKGTWENVKDWIAGAFSIAAIFEFSRQLFSFLSGSVDEFKKFETAAQNLKGETQMTGETLEFFKKQAVETGEAFGKTGDEMLQAYNAIASGKSDLLENKEALAAVTDEAIRLSLAGEMDVPEAAKVMVESLNQFGAGADSAAKYVDILATGTIVGAGKIQEIGAALKYVGPVAQAAGLSFGITNSALQILHQNGIKSEQAGTALRGVLSQLMKGADETNPSIVGLEVALANLEKKNLSAKDAIKLFGTENVSAGLALVKNTQTLKEWTAKIEEGGGAATMLADKTKTVEFQTKQAEAAMKNQMVVIGQGLAPIWVDLLGLFRDVGIPVIQGVATAFITVVNVLKDLPKFLAENKELFIGLGVALVTLNGNMILATAQSIAFAASQRVQAIATAAAAVAQEGLNIVMNANPIALVISGIALLVGGFITLYNKSETLRVGLAMIWAGFKSVAGIVYDVIVAIANLDFKAVFDKITNSFVTVGKDMMAGARAEIQKSHADIEGDTKKHVDTKVGDEKAGNSTIKTDTINKNNEANSKKSEDNKKHRDEQLAANKDMLDKIDSAWAESLKDELASKKAQLLQKYEAEVQNIEKSKASERVKATWTKVLNENLINALEDLDKKYTKLKIDNLDLMQAKEFRAVDNSEKMQERLHNRIMNWEEEKKAATERTQQAELRANQEKFSALGSLMDGDLQGFTAAMGKKINSVASFKLNALGQYMEFAQKVSEYINNVVAKFADAARSMIEIAQMRVQIELNLIEKNKQAETKAVRDELKNQEDAIIDLDAKIAKLNEELYFEKDENRKADLQAEIDKLNKEKEAIVTQKNATSAELTKIEKDYDNKVRQQKLEAWEKQKDLEVKMALINATQAYIKALSSGFPPFNYTTAALVLRQAKEQVELIRSEPAPDFEQGTYQPMRDTTYFENAGTLGGLRHNSPEGGNWVINPRNGKLLAKVEEGEFLGVFSRSVNARHGDVLRKLANSSLARTGHAIYAEDGFYGDLNTGAAGDVTTASGMAAAATADLSNIDNNTAATVQAVRDAINVLYSLGGTLSDIAESSRRNADKPPVSVRQVMSGVNNVSDVISLSSFG